MEADASRRLLRFGVFEVDLRAGELRKNGVKIKLQEQPFQILAMLLEHPGEIVTREELQQKLWCNDTFVDFDNSLNKAINKIRESLGDSADNPRFVETMARRGYRFIAPVDGPSTAAAIPETLAAATRPGSRWLLPMAIGIGVILVIASAGVTWRLTRPSTPTRVLTRLTSDTGLTTDPALSPDGKLLAYASDRSGEGNLDVWVKQVAGGEPLRLTRDEADDRAPTFSPDGSQIAFRSEREGGGIYIVSSLGGDPRPIAKRGFDPRFSPDGRWILYGNGYDKIYVVLSSGGAPKQLASDFHVAMSPRWAPDGKHLLFYGTRENVLLDYSNSGDFGDWWVAPLDGGAATQTGAWKALRRAGLSLCAPAVWLSESHQIVFTANHGDTGNVWQIPISATNWRVTGDPQQLTFGTGNVTPLTVPALAPNFEGHPSVSTGGRLAFAACNRNFEIWALPLDAKEGKVTGEMRRLTHNAAEDFAFDLSSDGRKLLFHSNRSGNWDVWLKDLEDGKEKPITTTPSNEWWPKMTADGSKVSYEAREDNDKAVIYVVPVSGGVPERVCDDCAGPWQWSPDGKSFTFRIPPDRKERVGLFNLTTGKRTELLKRRNSDVESAQFSPDNRWIAFTVDSLAEDGSSHLFVAGFRGEEELREDEWIAVTEPTAICYTPRWSPDGNLLYFASNQDGFFCIWAQHLDPATKHPFGPAFSVYHFHRAQLPRAVFSVARNKMVFTLSELTGNIWMTTIKQ
jgi:eukaryotic-like serine/threonine-protein kinase